VPEDLRFETFGDEQVWTDTLRLHQVVEKNVDPTPALMFGLKVDADVLPPGILEKVDLIAGVGIAGSGRTLRFRSPS